MSIIFWYDEDNEFGDKLDDISIPEVKVYALTIITAAGAIVLAWGVFEFASAYQSRDTAQQTDSLKKVVAGILMCLAPTIINLLK